MKILVTGGAGFIGSNIVRALNRKGLNRITIVDHLDDFEKWRNLSDLRYEAYFEKDNLFDWLLAHKKSPFDLMIHMGACTDTQSRKILYLMRTNTFYSKTLFDYCVNTGCRFIYASSGATYGLGEHGFKEEAVNLHPTTPYGNSKYLFDCSVLKNARKPPQCVGLRFFNVYGFGEAHKGPMASMAYHGFQQIQKTGTMRLFKYGKQQRDFIYIKDVVNVVLFFAEHSKKSGLFNVGTGHARSFLDLANALFAILDKKPRIKFFDIPKSMKKTYQNFTQADVRKLRATGYRIPFTQLEDGVAEYIKSYLSK